LKHTNSVEIAFHALSLNEVKEEQIIRISNALTKYELNAKNDDDNTLLHLSAKKAYNNLFAQLLYLGADPTLRNKDGSTAIDLFNLP
jgi:ankyrin repeat protein